MKRRKDISHRKPAHKKQVHQHPLFTGRLIVPMFLSLAVFVGVYLVMNGTDFFSFANSSIWVNSPFVRFRPRPTSYPTGGEGGGCIKCGFGCLPAREQMKVKCPEVLDDSFKCVSLQNSDGTQYCQTVPVEGGVNSEGSSVGEDK